jgi:ACT domain-containing protein
MLEFIKTAHKQGLITETRMLYLILCLNVQKSKLSVAEACDAFNISRATYYNVKKTKIQID